MGALSWREDEDGALVAFVNGRRAGSLYPDPDWGVWVAWGFPSSLHGMSRPFLVRLKQIVERHYRHVMTA